MGGLISKSLITALLKTEGIDLTKMCTSATASIDNKIESEVDSVIPKITGKVDPVVSTIESETPRYIQIATISFVIYICLFLFLLLMQFIALLFILKKK
jgi:hypothetical protein